MADGIDLKEWRKLTRDLHAFHPDKQVKKVLRGAGDRIAADARELVAPYSNTIPATIRVRVSGTSVTVSAGGGGQAALARRITRAGYGTKEAEERISGYERRGAAAVSTGAIAGLFEFGNKGRQGGRAGKVFRHPVFGRDVWVDQKMHRYLIPARERNRHAIEHLEGEIVAEAFREVGWHGA